MPWAVIAMAVRGTVATAVRGTVATDAPRARAGERSRAVFRPFSALQGGSARRRGRGRVGRSGGGSPRFGCRRREEQHWERDLSSIGRCNTLGGATPLAARGGEGCKGSQADGRRRSARCCQSGKNICKLKKMLAFVEAFKRIPYLTLP
jgi:hypothetical protein